MSCVPLYFFCSHLDMLFEGHPKADIAILASDGTVFGARKLSLMAHSQFVEDNVDLAEPEATSLVNGLPSLRVSATANALDFVLGWMHNADLHAWSSSNIDCS